MKTKICYETHRKCNGSSCNYTAHTPGPWRTGDMFKTVFGPKREGVASPITIANVKGLNLETIKANARLIAAAPELLEACESARKVFQGWLHDIDPHNELGNDNPERAAACNMIERMSAAITKAITP